MSSILQYLSFETLEGMLYQMKTLNLGKVKKEFLMLTAFHGNKFCDEIALLEGVDDTVKEGFRQLVVDFMADLFKMAELDDQTLAEELNSNSALFTSATSAAHAAQHTSA